MKIERLEHCEKSKHFINIFGLKYKKKNYKEKWNFQYGASSATES